MKDDDGGGIEWDFYFISPACVFPVRPSGSIIAHLKLQPFCLSSSVPSAAAAVLNYVRWEEMEDP